LTDEISRTTIEQRIYDLESDIKRLDGEMAAVADRIRTAEINPPAWLPHDKRAEYILKLLDEKRALQARATALQEEKNLLRAELHRERERAPAAAAAAAVNAATAGVPGSTIDMAGEIRSMKQLLEGISLNVHGAPSPTPSPSQRGNALLERCPDKLLDIVPQPEQKAVLSIEDHVALTQKFMHASESRAVRENGVTALLTPYLSAAFANAMGLSWILVNSEEYKWIRTDKNVIYDLKPDLFVCHRSAFLSASPPTSIAVRDLRMHSSSDSDCYHFGRCAWKLADSVLCFIEVKIKISLNEAIGEADRKAMALLSSSKGVVQRCCLVSLDEFYLLKFTASGLLSVRHWKWTTAGSLKALEDFLDSRQSPVCSILNQAISAAPLRQLKPTLPLGGYLGSGLHGTAFRLSLYDNDARQQMEYVAKVVSTATDSLQLEALKYEDLRTYRAQLKTAAERAALSQITISAHSLQSLTSDRPRAEKGIAPGFILVDGGTDGTAGAVLLVAPVGKSIYHESRDAKLLEAVLDVLHTLHCFRIVHGDARLANIIRTEDGCLRWIDYRTMLVSTENVIGMRNDLWTLLSGFPHPHAESQRFTKLLDDYAKLMTEYLELQAPSSTTGSAAAAVSASAKTEPDRSLRSQQAWPKFKSALLKELFGHL
jgi:hypothetical protein